MNRRIGVGIGLALLVLAIVLWQCHGSSTKSGMRAGTTGAGAATAGSAASTGKNKPDPRTQPRGSIAGTVRDDAKAPIAGATVCADTYSDVLRKDETPDPRCVATDLQGAFVMSELYAASYRITAVAKTFRPEAFLDGGERGKSTFDLAAGQARTGVDIVLHKGGVEITGTVSDVTGGPIANAIVRAGSGFWGRGDEGPVTLSDQNGAFALWVVPGTVRVSAMAEGYARATSVGRAPGTFAVLLTPESSLAGTVVDARTGEPVADANVELETRGPSDWSEGQWDRTDAQGKFRVTKLTPGRYTITARTQHGYGRTEGSTLVGLGQHVDGVTVKLFLAIKITGKVMIAGTPPTLCKEGGVWMKDAERDSYATSKTEDDGTVIAEGVLPGSYKPQVWCKGHKSRDSYPPIVVADKDIENLVWEVDGKGGTIRGRVVTQRGEPIPDARISGQTKGGEARAETDWVSETSRFDGTFEIEGLNAATYGLEVSSDRGIAPKHGFTITVAAGATVEQDLVLDDAGTIRGTVADSDGAPVEAVTVHALGADQRMVFGMDAPIKTDAAGAFTIPGLRPGDFRVTARRGMWGQTLRKPGTTDDSKQGEKAVVKAGETTTVKLVVESQRASIKGTVVDPKGAPVADAYISSARESDAAGAQRGGNVSGTRGWGWGDATAPIVTATDGTFTVDKLSPGKYTLRAYRKGGGEAVAEHVATGSTVKLEIKPTGSISGAAVRPGGKPPDELTVTLEDAKTGFEREESYYRTDGRFVVNDLPAGAFKLTVRGQGGSKVVDVALAEGETKTGITVTLEQLISITGRVVDSITKQPVEGMRVFASLAAGGNNFSWNDEDRDNISDASGKFTVKRVPVGQIAIQGMPKDWKTSRYSWFRVLKSISGTSDVDVGDLLALQKRLQEGEVAGELGVRFVDQPDDTPPEKQKLEVSFIEPGGAAANSGLRVGDVLNTIDGVDVTGEASATAWTLMRAPAGTKLSIGLARGATITITLKAPS